MTNRPTKNPRIAFVPSDAVHALVGQLSELSGESRAGIVSDFMDQMEPVIRGQIEAFRKIAARPEEARQYVQDLANESTAMIAQAVLDLDKPKQKRGRKPKDRGRGAANTG
jgi:uncharacterized protein YbjQ (UPF0145 family)